MKHLRNLDLDLDKWLVKKDGTAVGKLKELKYQPLSREIYFNPSNSPLISQKDQNLGSCLRDWIVPSAAYDIVHDGSTYTLSKNRSLVGLDDYRDKLWDGIKQNISQIYNQHQEVTLCYSGGIDSLVLLVTISYLGLTARTRLLTFSNLTQKHESCAHINPERKRSINQVLSHFEKRCLGVEYLELGIESVIRAANNYTRLRCYVTNELMHLYQNRAWIFGHHGNQLLLHKDIFAHEILIRQPNQWERLFKLKESDAFYTKSLANINEGDELVDLDRRHMLMKPWIALDNINGNKIYQPLGDDRMLAECRSLDFSKIDIDYIAHASLAKELIIMSGHEWLLSFLSSENLNDLDNLKDIVVPVKDLDLTIPNLHHDSEGLDWVDGQRDLALSSGFIPINSLVSIKNLQWINQL